MPNTILFLKNARTAGLLYLALIITGAYSVVYVPSKIFRKEDTDVTTKNIIEYEELFRSGIVSDVISNLCFILLVMILYQFLNPVNSKRSKLMVVLVLVQVPALFFMEALNFTSLMILKGQVLQSFSIAQKKDIAILFQQINNYGQLTVQMFWGAWLIPFGLLVYKSKFIPKLFGIFLIGGGIVYMLDSLSSLAFPNYRNELQPHLAPAILLSVALGEVSMMCWFMIKGFGPKTFTSKHLATENP